MRLFTSALCTTIAIGLLAGCVGNMSAPSATVPSIDSQSRPISVDGDTAPPQALTVLHALVPDRKRKKPPSGIYVSLFGGTDILGYPANNKGNKGPTCTVTGVSSVNDVAVDGKGNLMDPDGGSGYLMLFKGPGMCGKSLGVIADSYGQPSDASSLDAATGKIALGNIRDKSSSNGSLSVCTLKAGCTANLTNADMYEAGGVAMANNGDCWVDAKPTSSGGAALIYFKGCAGAGKIATGFKSTYYGDIDIDNSGHLVIIDEMALAVYIYSGCTPKCKVIGGPFSLKAESFFGKLNKANTDYAAVDRTDGVVDVYSFSEKGIKYEYEFSKGLTASLAPEGVAQNPRSKQ
ncbi:MAG: hypothetical protein WAK16_11590 [Candidatus Cybelea sp.]|jgi:hypothetical protein